MKRRSLPLRRASELARSHRVATENNVQRIVLEMLAVTLSKHAQADLFSFLRGTRPSPSNTLGPTVVTSMQQACLRNRPSQLRRHFDGSHVIEQRTAELREAATQELNDVLELGGASNAIETLKSRLVGSMAERTRSISSGEQTVVGVNSFTESEPLPRWFRQFSVLTPLLKPKPSQTWRPGAMSDQTAVEQALGDSEMQPSMAGTSWKPQLRLQLPEEPPVNGVGPCEMSMASTGSNRYRSDNRSDHSLSQVAAKVREMQEARCDYSSPSPVSTDTQMEPSRSRSQLVIRDGSRLRRHSINNRSNWPRLSMKTLTSSGCRFSWLTP